MSGFLTKLEYKGNCLSKEANILWSHHEEIREHEETRELPGEKDNARNNTMHAGAEDHALPGWTTSISLQDFPWKSQSE